MNIIPNYVLDLEERILVNHLVHGCQYLHLSGTWGECLTAAAKASRAAPCTENDLDSIRVLAHGVRTEAENRASEDIHPAVRAAYQAIATIATTVAEELAT